jgi:hypothetical protein
MMDTRTRWIIGLLLALVVGLGVALIIVAGDDSDSGEPVTTENTATATLTEPTTTSAPTTSTATGATGGTPVPGGTTTVPDGQGGL